MLELIGGRGAEGLHQVGYVLLMENEAMAVLRNPTATRQGSHPRQAPNGSARTYDRAEVGAVDTGCEWLEGLCDSGFQRSAVVVREL
jgi:hypothetical protein